MWIPSAIPNRDPTTERRKKGQRRRASLLNLIVKAGLFYTHRDYVALRSGNEQGGACLRHAPPAHSHSWAHGGTPPAPRATASKHRTPVALTSPRADWRRPAPSAPSSPSRDGGERWARGSATRPPLTPIS